MKQLYVFGTMFILLTIVQIVYGYFYRKVRHANNTNKKISLSKDNLKDNDIITTKEKQYDKDFIFNFGRRLKVSWTLFFTLLIPFCFGYFGITLFFLLVSFLALREFVSIMHLKAGDYWPIFCSFYIFLPLQYFFVLTDVQFLFYIFIPVYVFLLSPMLSVASDDDDQFFERASKFQWAQIACIYCVSYIPAIAGMQLRGGEFESSTLLLFFLLNIFSSDTLQYIFGNILGKRKIAPKFSPNKTYEGLIWGTFLTVLFGMSLYWLTPFKWWQCGLLSFMLCVVGFVGGLIMSGIKRSLKIKDWSSLLGSHGGVLDRLDSMIFTAPLFYHICKYFFA